MISISNSFEGHIVIDDDTELPVSTKKGTGHGLGLTNIRRVYKVKKFDLILSKAGDNILYASKAYDITQDVINGLNKSYKGGVKDAKSAAPAKKEETKK